MRVLVTWGSTSGGTAGLGQEIAAELARHGLDVAAVPADRVLDVGSFDAAIIGGALHANLWQSDAYRFATRNLDALKQIPVWLFSSGPLDDSADRQQLHAPKQVAILAERLGALGHTTFGGRLEPDAKGFPASAMARKLSGDWRNHDRVRAFADDIAASLPTALPGVAYEPPAGALWRLVLFGVVGWALCAALMALLQATLSPGWALGLHAAGAPIIFGVLSYLYFGAYGARDPLPTAAAFTAIVVLLDVFVVAGLVLRDFTMFASAWGTWVPFALIFAVTWAVGQVMLMIPTPDLRTHVADEAARGSASPAS